MQTSATEQVASTREGRECTVEAGHCTAMHRGAVDINNVDVTDSDEPTVVT